MVYLRIGSNGPAAITVGLLGPETVGLANFLQLTLRDRRLLCGLKNWLLLKMYGGALSSLNAPLRHTGAGCLLDNGER